MIKTHIRTILVALFTVVITGCAGLPQQQAYNHQANSHIKRIAVVKPYEPEEVQVYYFNHPGLQGGLVGAIIAETEFSNKTTEYNAVFAQNEFNPVDYLVGRLEEELKDGDFEVVTIDSNVKEPGVFMTKYPDQDVDAYLDSYFHNYGYFAGSPEAAYKPTIGLQVRLVDKKTESLLYANQLITGESFAARENSRYIGHTEIFSFPYFEDLLGSPNLSFEGIKDALDRIAENLASELAGRTQTVAAKN